MVYLGQLVIGLLISSTVKYCKIFKHTQKCSVKMLLETETRSCFNRFISETIINKYFFRSGPVLEFNLNHNILLRRLLTPYN